MHNLRTRHAVVTGTQHYKILLLHVCSRCSSVGILIRLQNGGSEREPRQMHVSFSLIQQNPQVNGCLESTRCVQL